MIRLSRAQVRAVDRIAIEEYGIPGIVLMENAARSAVDVLRKRFLSLQGKRVAIACGPGNNGGDGFAIARHLSNLGARPIIVWTIHERMIPRLVRGDARLQLDIAATMKIPFENQSGLASAEIVIDCLFGTGLTRPIIADDAMLIETINRSSAQIVAIDLPSGLDCDTGLPIGDVCVKADFTVTFVAEKLGFANPLSKQYTGEVVVGDIGCPREIIDRVLREIPVRGDGRES